MPKTVWLGNWECGETFTSLRENQTGVDSERKEGVTAWQAQPVLETEQFDTAIT